MAQFLDTTGLQTLWNKIKETFVPQNWLMANYVGSLKQTTAMSSTCPSFPITSGDVGFYRDSSSNVSGETQYHLYCVTSSNIDLCMCSFKIAATNVIQNVIRTMINSGIVSMSGNFTTGVTLTPLRKIVKFSDNEYLVPKNIIWIFYDNFNDALSALLSGGADVVSS